MGGLGTLMTGTSRANSRSGESLRRCAGSVSESLRPGDTVCLSDGRDVGARDRLYTDVFVCPTSSMCPRNQLPKACLF